MQRYRCSTSSLTARRSRLRSRSILPARSTSARLATHCPPRRSPRHAMRTRSCSARWAGRRCAIPTAPRSRRSSTCASHCELYAGVRPARALPGIAAAARRSARAATSISCSSASPPRACSPRAARAWSIDDREARDTMVITRKGSERVHEFAFRLARAAPRARPPGRGHLRRQGQRVRVDGVLPQDLRRASPRDTRTCAARHHYVDATALDLVRKPWDVRRPGHREHVRRHPVGPGARRSSAAWAWRRRPTSATQHALFQPCHGSAPDIAGQGKANPDRDDPVGGDDAGLARRARHGDRGSRRRRAASRPRSTRCSLPAACCRSSSAAATARRRSPPR